MHNRASQIYQNVMFVMEQSDKTIIWLDGFIEEAIWLADKKKFFFHKCHSSSMIWQN